ncbi:hypothetical protein AM233_02165 [Bacillus sp. FJAT-22058]|nr:hypothetical protein AM233_02165 [Bacillus sp. FJAT-22058]
MLNSKNVFGYEKNSWMIWLNHNAGISEDKLEKKASLTAVIYLKNVPVDFRNPFLSDYCLPSSIKAAAMYRLASNSAGVSQICSIQ